MARELDCLIRRDLLNDAKQPADRLIELGCRFAGEGYLSDAVDFLWKAGDTESLEALLPQVIEDGDYFLLTRVTKALGRPAGEEELRLTAENAEKLGKDAFAAAARRMLETEEAS